MMLLMGFSFVGMTLFCLAMTKHRKQVFIRHVNPAIGQLFRPLAWLIMWVTFALSVQNYGWSIGPAVFFGALGAAVLFTILLLTYMARMLPWLAALVGIFASTSLIFTAV